MNILISNDDGFQAPGIASLHRALSEQHTTTVVAPRENCSGFSSSITLTRPVAVEETHPGHYVADGTPVDCVHLGVTALLKDPPDMVVAGINAGRNIGDDVLYSGTVGAAMEGRHLGLPAIAVSLAGGHDMMHYDTAAKLVALIVDRLSGQWEHSLPADAILNINVPDRPWDQIAGVRVTQLGRRQQAKPAKPHTNDAEVNTVQQAYWVGAAGSVDDSNPNNDFAAIQQGYASITPLTSDLTRDNHANILTDWIQAVDFGH